MADDTSIRVRKSTWRQLHRMKEPGDSMDDVLRELLENRETDGEPVEAD